MECPLLSMLLVTFLTFLLFDHILAIEKAKKLTVGQCVIVLFLLNMKFTKQCLELLWERQLFHAVKICLFSNL